jgi:phage I-like protein
MAAPESDGVVRFGAIPWGTTELADKEFREWIGEPGVIHVDELTAAELPARFAAKKNDFALTELHGDGRAAGWLTDVGVDQEQGAWYDVQMTDFGRELVASDQYRYSSADVQLLVSMDRKEGWLVGIIGGALTNKPAVAGMAPVELARIDNPGPDQSDVTPDDGEKGQEAMGEMWDSFKAHLSRKRPGSDPIDDEASAINAVSEMADENASLSAQNTKLTADLETVKTELAKLKTASEKAEKENAAKAAVAEAVADGRVGLFQVEKMTELATADMDAFKALTDGVEKGTFSAPTKKVMGEKAEHGKGDGLEGATPEERSKAIQEYADKKDIPFHKAALALMKEGKV